MEESEEEARAASECALLRAEALNLRAQNERLRDECHRARGEAALLREELECAKASAEELIDEAWAALRSAFAAGIAVPEHWAAEFEAEGVTRGLFEPAEELRRKIVVLETQLHHVERERDAAVGQRHVAESQLASMQELSSADVHVAEQHLRSNQAVISDLERELDDKEAELAAALRRAGDTHEEAVRDMEALRRENLRLQEQLEAQEAVMARRRPRLRGVLTASILEEVHTSSSSEVSTSFEDRAKEIGFSSSPFLRSPIAVTSSRGDMDVLHAAQAALKASATKPTPPRFAQALASLFWKSPISS
jgi:myosin heavy subunit